MKVMVKVKSKGKPTKSFKTKKKSGVTTYTVGDFLIRLKNASLARHVRLQVPSSKAVKELANALKKEGYLDEIYEEQGNLFVRLVYKNKEPVLTDVRLISKPGLRVYKGVNELERLKGPSIYFVSTPKGVMSSKEAIKRRLGGEVIAEIL